MSIAAETLLMTTGLVNAPDRSSLIASRTVLKEILADLLAAIDQDDPKRLTVCQIKPTYIDRIAKEPDYELWMEWLEPRLGLADAGSYQLLHQTARQYIISRYPGNKLTGIVGSISAPPDEVGLCRWRFLVDTLENQRIGKDLQGAALLPANVEAFKACFPESYQFLVDRLSEELDKRSAKANGKWRPSWWQDHCIRVFKQAPPKPAPPPPKAPVPEKKDDVKIPFEKLEPVDGL